MYDVSILATTFPTNIEMRILRAGFWVMGKPALMLVVGKPVTSAHLVKKGSVTTYFLAIINKRGWRRHSF